jgi:hypothetical protein
LPRARRHVEGRTARAAERQAAQHLVPVRRTPTLAPQRRSRAAETRLRGALY